MNAVRYCPDCQCALKRCQHYCEECRDRRNQETIKRYIRSAKFKWRKRCEIVTPFKIVSIYCVRLNSRQKPRDAKWVKQFVTARWPNGANPRIRRRKSEFRKYCSNCIATGTYCGSVTPKLHRRLLAFEHPNRKARKRANQARYRLNPECKAKEKAYAAMYNREVLRKRRPGFAAKQVKRFERRKKQASVSLKTAVSRAIRQQQSEAKRICHACKIAFGISKRRTNKPDELKGLNSRDWDKMTIDQRKLWGRWIRSCYPDRIRKDRERWRSQNPDKVKACAKAYKRSKARCVFNWHARLSKYPLLVGIKIESAKTLRGCSTAFFIHHIEQHMISAMTWDNYGKTWELDHVKPVCSFDLMTKAGRIACNHWSNAQPLSKEDNQAKGDYECGKYYFPFVGGQGPQ